MRITPLLQHIEMYTYRDYGLILCLNSYEDFDEALLNWFTEAYALGS
jgi:GTPase SAR1 family protein